MNPPSARVVSILLVTSLTAFLFVPVVTASDDPEIVRLSHAEGDVRVSQGRGGKLKLDGTWSQADAGIRIEEGFTLATGSGRAIIEFENGWTAYLADDSTLQFKTLRSRKDVPQTELNLLTGTLSVDFRPGPREELLVYTPSGERAVLRKGGLFRIESYLDTISFTPLDADGMTIQAWNRNIHLYQGESAFTIDGLIYRSYRAESGAPADWDEWVYARARQREAILPDALKASGLSSPISGLVDLYKNGTFFDCAPYGKCWEPNSLAGDAPEPSQDAADDQTGNGAPMLVNTSSPIDVATKAGPQNGPQLSSSPPSYFTRRYPNSDCTQTVVGVERDPQTGVERVVKSWQESGPWDWGECYAGSFIYRRRPGYIWVVGKKHHHPPCRWVRINGRVGYVPRHPLDLRGKPPVNLKYGVLVPSLQEHDKLETVMTGEGARVNLLKTTPLEFKALEKPNLVSAAPPKIEAHFWAERDFVGRSTPTKPGEMHSSITYDYSRHSFVREGPSVAGHPASPVIVGELDSHGAFFGSRGGFSGTGRSGGGSEERGGSGSRGGGNSGSYSGGGGGYSGSGGGFHGSGGGGFGGGGGGGSPRR
jgi:hypothetical protein